MTYKCKKSRNNNVQHIEGNGRTEAENLVNDFARQADITVDEGFKILDDRQGHGVDSEKAATFCEAVRDEYGSLDTLKMVCEASAPAPKVA
jgi:hypothetical protein